MSKSIQLINGNLATADFLSAAAKRRDPCIRDITRDGNGRITQISWFSDNGRTQELYRKEITWGSGLPTLAKHTDYVYNVTRCRTLAKVGGAFQIEVGICPGLSLLWGTVPIQWGDLNLDWSAGGDTAWGDQPIRWGTLEVTWT
jgi:hypothetical protein